MFIGWMFILNWLLAWPVCQYYRTISHYNQVEGGFLVYRGVNLVEKVGRETLCHVPNWLIDVSFINQNNYQSWLNFFSLRAHPPSKTKISTTYWIVTKLYRHQDMVNATSHFEFQVDISILATVRKELATLRKLKLDLC